MSKRGMPGVRVSPGRVSLGRRGPKNEAGHGAGLLALGITGTALAQVYKWVDADGRVHYGAQPPAAAKARPLSLQQPHSVNPESNVEVPESAIQYYPVYGRTPLELHMSMKQNGPFNEIVQQREYNLANRAFDRTEALSGSPFRDER